MVGLGNLDGLRSDMHGFVEIIQLKDLQTCPDFNGKCIISKSVQSVYKFNYGHFGNVAYKREREPSDSNAQDYPEEVKLLRKLRHSNIVLLLGIVMSDRGYVGFLCEFLSNGDLAQVYREMKYNKEQIVCWLRQASAGLSYLHSNGIVHRDVKPSNMFVGYNYMLLKMGDLGISTELANAETSKKGTPIYRAPEVFDVDDSIQNQKDMRGELFWHFKSDVYSLAISAWEICEQEKPYKSCSNSNPSNTYDMKQMVVDNRQRPWMKKGRLNKDEKNEFSDLLEWMEKNGDENYRNRYTMEECFIFLKNLSSDDNARIYPKPDSQSESSYNPSKNSSMANTSTTSENAALLPMKTDLEQPPITKRPGRYFCMSSTLLLFGAIFAIFAIVILVIIIKKGVNGGDGFYVVQQYPTCFDGEWKAYETWPVKTPSSKSPYSYRDYGEYKVHFLPLTNPLYVGMSVCQGRDGSCPEPTNLVFDTTWHNDVRVTLLDHLRFRKERRYLADEEWICIDGGIRLKNETTVVQFRRSSV